MRVLIVLGSSNDEAGRLSTNALSRAETALAEYRRLPGSKFLLTGGYGAHFNTTDKPHAYYVAGYLTGAGVPSRDILEFAESSNTLEDAALSRRILERLDLESVTVITSDYHMKRARMIFEKIFAPQSIQFREAPSRLAPADYERACSRENEAIEKLKQSGF